MNTADYIIRKLEELGVNDFFGVPGDYNFNILYAVKNNPNTKWIGCTNELNAGYAADGYARVKGYGALITTYGVGELSAINAVAGSNAENVPIVHIVGTPSSKSIENKTLIHHNFQDVNYNAFIDSYKSVTAATAFLTRDNAKMEIDRVFKVMVKEKRPVYIALPIDVAVAEIFDKYVPSDWTSNKDTLEEAAQKAAKKINSSKNPVIIGDILVKRFDSEFEYKEFVSKSNIPVTNFLMGTNLIDANYEKYIGGYFGNVKNPIAQNYVENSDCIISIGTIYSDLNSFGQRIPKKLNNDIAIYGTYTYIDGVRYDDIKMSELLESITKKIEPKNIEIEKPNIGYKVQEVTKEPLTTETIYSRLQEFFKENDIIFGETGLVPLGLSCINYPCNADIEFQILWGSIGWATPAALGANIARPQSRIILVTGEGAHLMTAMEVGNMLKNGIKPIVVVINNDGYTIERALCENRDDDFNNIVNLNYSKFVRAFAGDIWATKVNTAEDFDKALKVTQIINKMCYIEACTEKMDMPNTAKSLISEIKKAPCTQKIVMPAIMQTQLRKQEAEHTLTFNYGDSNYETIVHQSFSTNTSGENRND